jgi:hypothetical protein
VAIGSSHTYKLDGWYETISEGIATIYFAAVDEGIVTGPSDTPANKQFFPRIKNAEQFSIKRAPTPWTEGQTQVQGAGFGTLQIDNRDGAYSFLLGSDLRDTEVIIKLPKAKMLTTATEMHDAFLVATCIIENISSDDEDTISVQFKDTIARLDKTLPVRYNPAFVDEGAANAMIPLTFGAFRNRKGLMIDAENRVIQIHDENVPNVVKVADMAAPLDPYASPPQYTPGPSAGTIQLDTDPVGVVTIDGSPYGSQATIPGDADVLDGAGEFTGTWTGSPAVPPGWTFSHNTGSSIIKVTNPPYGILGTSNGVRIHTTKVFQAGVTYGDYLEYVSILKGGSTYRITFGLYDVQAEQPFFVSGMVGGVILATKLSNNAADYVTGITNPLSTTAFNQQRFSFEFTIPKGADRNLYFLFVPSAGNAGNTAQGAMTGTLFDVKLELVGQFVDMPLTPIPFADYVNEILVQRAGEDVSIYNAAEAESMFLRADGSLIPFACCFDNPPNILDCLRMALDSNPDGPGVMFTDANNVLRFRKFKDPADPANNRTIKADFTPYNVLRGVKTSATTGQYLTTLLGARRNWYVFQQSDFVTDTAVVPLDEKTRFQRTSQFTAKASVTPASQYAAAISAPIFDTVLDEQADAQALADTVVGIYAPKVYSDGSITNGKCRLITFTVKFDDPEEVGATIKAACTDIQFGDIIRLDYPDKGINNAKCLVLWPEIFPFSKQLTLTVFYKETR